MAFYLSETERELKKAPKHIKGISCDVTKCAYHDGDCYCTANRVAVGPSFAKCAGDTVCATFKERELS